MEPTDYRRFIGLLRELVNEGRVPISRIDDASLVSCGSSWQWDSWIKTVRLWPIDVCTGASDLLNTVESRVSVCGNLWCFSRTRKDSAAVKKIARIHVGGQVPTIWKSCGGWTIDWQGKSGNITTGGTTILKAIQAAVSPATRKLRFS